MATDIPRPDKQHFLGRLTAEEHHQLCARGRPRRYPKGATLFNEADVSNHVVVILRGRVKVSYVTQDGREIVFAVRGEGDLLGELSALDGEPRSATATALEPVEAVSVSAEDFREFLVKEHPGAAVKLLTMLTQRLRDADRKRVEFGAYDTIGRVATRLIELAERFGNPHPEGVRVDLPLSQQEIAGWVGSSREAVSKALSILRSRGWIETRRKGVTILDWESLRRRGT